MIENQMFVNHVMLNTHVLVFHTVTYIHIVVFEWFKMVAWKDGPGYSGLDAQMIGIGQNRTNLQLISLHHPR